MFFSNLANDSIISAEVRSDPALDIGEESLAVEGLQLDLQNWSYHQGIFDIAPDGSRFLTVLGTGGPETIQMVVVRNWFEELKRLMQLE